MDRAIVIAFAALGLAIAAAMGAGIGFAFYVSDPANQARQQCSYTHCINFKITSRTFDRVDYTYDTPDGSHCIGYEQVTRRGFLGMPSGGGGGASCAPAGQPIALPGHPPPPPTPFPDGNPGCANTGPMALSGPFPTPTGFEIRATNSGGSTCDVGGPVDIQLLDFSGPPLGIREVPANEPRSFLALQPGATVALDVDYGRTDCHRVARMFLMAPLSGPALSGPPGTVCGPLTTHQARLVTSAPPSPS